MTDILGLVTTIILTHTHTHTHKHFTNGELLLNSHAHTQAGRHPQTHIYMYPIKIQKATITTCTFMLFTRSHSLTHRHNSFRLTHIHIFDD